MINAATIDAADGELSTLNDIMEEIPDAEEQHLTENIEDNVNFEVEEECLVPEEDEGDEITTLASTHSSQYTDEKSEGFAPLWASGEGEVAEVEWWSRDAEEEGEPASAAAVAGPPERFGQLRINVVHGEDLEEEEEQEEGSPLYGDDGWAVESPLVMQQGSKHDWGDDYSEVCATPTPTLTHGAAR
jgi:hypothetical protein